MEHPPAQSHRFTGKPLSISTGLYYDYQRWYDPSVGRYISQDPLGGDALSPQTLNGYVYVQNRPTSLVDPMGLTSEGEGDRICSEDESCGIKLPSWVYDEDAARSQWGFSSNIGRASFNEGSPPPETVSSIQPVATEPIRLEGGAGSRDGQLEFLNPKTLAFTQNEVSPTFQDGRTIAQLSEGLRTGQINPTTVSPIRVVEFEGKLYSLDNRRLVAFQMADVNIPVVRASWTPKVTSDFVWRYNPVQGGSRVFINGVGWWPPTSSEI
jgi:RHS repeat-associated protein